jgi:thioredoxin-like negative regulator of GroEL
LLLNNCAWLLQEAGFLDPAEQWARKSLEYYKGSPESPQHTLGTILARQSKFTEAEPLLKPHCAMDNATSADLVPLLACYRANGKSQQAAELARRIDRDLASLDEKTLAWYHQLLYP